MSSMGEYPIPDELKDEDKWFKFFTLKQLMFVGAAACIDAVIIKVGIVYDALLVSLVIAGIILGFVMLVTMKKIPKEKYIYGSGKPLYSLLIARIIRKGHKTICIKNYDGGVDDK